MAQTTSVLWSADQGLGSDEQAQARQNIGAAGTADIPSLKREDQDGTQHEIDEIILRRKSLGGSTAGGTTEIIADGTRLGSTVPLAVLSSDEGKVPVAYYRDNKAYFLLEKQKDSRIGEVQGSSDYRKFLRVDSHGGLEWAPPELMDEFLVMKTPGWITDRTVKLSNEWLDGDGTGTAFYGTVGFTTTSSGSMAIVPLDANDNLVCGDQSIIINGPATGVTNMYNFMFKNTTPGQIRKICIKGTSSTSQATITHLFVIKKH